MSNHSNFSKWSNHSTNLKWSNHSIMTISGHSTRSNSTFNGLVSKYAPNSNAEMQDNPFEPTPIPAVVHEDKDAMDMDMDIDEPEGPPKSYVPRNTNFDEGMAMGLGNLSDHSLMSNMSSIHSVKGFTAEEIFADTSMHGSNRDQNGASNHQSRRYRTQFATMSA